MTAMYRIGIADEHFISQTKQAGQRAALTQAILRTGFGFTI
jgi:hypothetical protein